MTADDAQIPREQLPVPLFDGVALAARAADGQRQSTTSALC